MNRCGKSNEVKTLKFLKKKLGILVDSQQTSSPTSLCTCVGLWVHLIGGLLYRTLSEHWGERPLSPLCNRCPVWVDMNRSHFLFPTHSWDVANTKVSMHPSFDGLSQTFAEAGASLIDLDRLSWEHMSSCLSVPDVRIADANHCAQRVLFWFWGAWTQVTVLAWQAPYWLNRLPGWNLWIIND